MHRFGWFLLCLAPLAALPVGAADDAAQEMVWDLPLPAGQRVAYTIDFEVQHPGRLEVTGDWSGYRVLSLRLEEIGSGAPGLRRSGPAPQTIALDVANPGDRPRQYRIHIRGLALREPGSGTITVRVPAAPAPTPPLLESLPAPIEPTAPETELPAGTPENWRRFSKAADGFAFAIENDPRGDNCRWQHGMADYLAEMRDELIAGTAEASPETLQALLNISEIIRDVEALAQSKDAAIAGPPPQNKAYRKLWERKREDQIRPVERELDTLLAKIERGHAPELRDQAWAYRMVTCVIGCERHFEERVRVGETKAVNRDLVHSQWDRLLEAAQLLETLTRLTATEMATRPYR